MSATETLRRMLDERVVHWWAGEDERKTLWESNGLTWEYFNDENGDAWLGFLGACESDVTPEQAIAATLGRGTCQQEEGGWSTEGDHARVWLTCGHDCMVETVADLPNFCPVCGARVVTA